MSYRSRYGRRPMEVASRSQHSHIINDASVQEYLASCSLPVRAEDVAFPEGSLSEYSPIDPNPIKHVFAVDGGYTEVAVQERFPSSRIAFFQFGLLGFESEDLKGLENSRFIDPDDMAKLKNIQRLSFTLPVRNIVLRNEESFTSSVRKTLFDFFLTKPEDDPLINTLAWLIFRGYETKSGYWELAHCPNCHERRVMLQRQKMLEEYKFQCPNCAELIYLTDVFRLHEAVDDELGAGGVLGYLTNTIEQLIVAHLVRLILGRKPGLMDEILIVRDGPLAFFGQTANMHTAFRQLVDYLFTNQQLYLVGLEKSGSFVEHADEISSLLDTGTVLQLSNEYIYKFILPGREAVKHTYGSTTYYSNKVIFKSKHGGMYVATLPSGEKVEHKLSEQPKNLNEILTNLELLRCDMYDNALIPVALANKLVSLSNHPSSRILQVFAQDVVANG